MEIYIEYLENFSKAIKVPLFNTIDFCPENVWVVDSYSETDHTEKLFSIKYFMFMMLLLGILPLRTGIKVFCKVRLV